MFLKVKQRTASESSSGRCGLLGADLQRTTVELGRVSGVRCFRNREAATRWVGDSGLVWNPKISNERDIESEEGEELQSRSDIAEKWNKS